MTVLQVTAYLAYLVVVIPAFVNAGRAVQPAASLPRPRRPTRPDPGPGPRPWAAGSGWRAGGRGR